MKKIMQTEDRAAEQQSSGKNYCATAILLFLSYHLLLTSYLDGAFKENIWTARSASVGGAFSAVSDDVSAIIFNPAGLAQIERNEAYFTYAQKFLNLPNIHLSNMTALFGYTLPKIGTFGFGYLSSDVSNLYTEQSIILSYSAPLHILLGKKTISVGRRTKDFPILPFPIYAGLNLKILSLKYSIDGDVRAVGDPVFAGGTSKGGVAADMGFLVKPTEKISAAITVKNLLTPYVGLVTEETVPMEFTLGGGYRFGDFGVFENLTVSLDLADRMPQDASSEFNWRLGLETWFGYHSYAARFGLNNTEIALGSGIIRSLGPIDVQLDYSFTLPFHISNNLGSHRISIATRF